MDLKIAECGTLVFISWGAPRKAHKALVDLIAGGQVSMSASGGVFSRFPDINCVKNDRHEKCAGLLFS